LKERESDMDDKKDLTREEFIKRIKNLGFPVNVMGREAYEKRMSGKDENSWLFQPKKEQEKPVMGDSQLTQNGAQGEDQEKERMAELARGDYPGITRQVRYFEEAKFPSCAHCGSTDTASVQIGVIGRTIAIACRTRKFHLIANGPRSGKYYCHNCKQYFD
jgi:hypothetical protein